VSILQYLTMISARWWQKYNVSLDFERFCTFTAQNIIGDI
jgi:hypothetical protein